MIDPNEWYRQYKVRQKLEEMDIPIVPIAGLLTVLSEIAQQVDKEKSCAADTVASLPATHIQSDTEDRPVLDEFTITDEYALAHLNMHNCMSCGQPYECTHTDANPRRHWIHFGERFGLCGECSALNNQEFVN